MITESEIDGVEIWAETVIVIASLSLTLRLLERWIEREDSLAYIICLFLKEKHISSS